MFEFFRKLLGPSENPDDKVERRYYRFRDQGNPTGPALTYVEAIDGWHLREISVSRDDTLASNVRHPVWGLVLCDDHCDYSDAGDGGELELVEITAQQFEQVWGDYLESRAGSWVELQRRYPEGRPVAGEMVAYYPQGIVVDLGDGDLGLVDHPMFRQRAGADGFARFRQLRGTVEGYDQPFQWLLLRDIQVSRARV